MPTYAYRCDACNHEFDQFQTITAAPLRTCPSCGKRKLKRLIGTGAGIIFKGSGFYETDYRSESYKQAAKAESQPAAKSDAGSTAAAASKSESAPKPSESKPAAAAASSADTKSSTKKSSPAKVK